MELISCLVLLLGLLIRSGKQVDSADVLLKPCPNEFHFIPSDRLLHRLLQVRFV